MGIRLPCRDDDQYSFGDDYNDLPKYGWHIKNAGSKSHPVGTLVAEPFRLFDMHGNLYGWCGDYYDEKWYAKSSPHDPVGPPNGAQRVLRGGFWNSSVSMSRSAYRKSDSPWDRDSDCGFGSWRS